jgi:glycosyltransferase 2 family protein
VSRPGPTLKLALKLGATLLFTALCVWLAFPQAEAFTQLRRGLAFLDWSYVWLYLLTAALMQLFRAWRWEYLLRPLGAHVPFWRLMSISSIGFMAILALPIRLGEFVRPYLVAASGPDGLRPAGASAGGSGNPPEVPGSIDQGRLRMSAALGSVAVERTVDGLLVSLYLFVSFLFLRGPHAGEARIVAWASFGLFATAIGYIALGVRWPDGVLRWTMRLTLLERLAPRFAGRLAHMVRGVIDGFRSLQDVRNFSIFLVMSVLYWFMNGFGMWVLARGFGLGLSLDGAFATMSVIAAAITLPNTPGLVGQFHAAGKFAMMLYLPAALVETRGMAYIVTLHAVQGLWYIGLGVLCMLVTSVSMGRVVRASQSAAVESATEASAPPPAEAAR